MSPRARFPAAERPLGSEKTSGQRPTQLNTSYGQHLTRPDRVDAERVTDMDAHAYSAMVAVVIGIITRFPTDSEADLAGREHLLAPLVVVLREDPVQQA